MQTLLLSLNLKYLSSWDANIWEGGGMEEEGNWENKVNWKPRSRLQISLVKLL